ncbi:MAG: hypothetical protein HDT28_04250 [Clostridiales bacterium]|nr:hypothetical protein [Clostridiales bacterium]
MKSKKLWLIVFAVFMCLAACLVGCSKNTVEPTALRITNKAELRAEWFEGGADRTLLIDIPSEISEKDIRVTSSNPSVVEADGMTLKAKSAGIAKITVIADDESDSVNITVKQAPSEIAIVNKNALEKIVVGESKTLEYAIKPDLFDVACAKIEIVSNNTNVVSVNGNTVTAVAQGNAIVTVSTFGFTDSVDIAVVALTAPTFGEATEVKGAVNTNVELPVTALSCDGADLREYITATCSDGISFDKNTMTVKAIEKGSYTVKLDVADPRDESLTASVTLIVNAYRNVFANVNGYGMVDLSAVSYEEDKQFVADEEQVVFFDRWDGTWAAFDAEPSKIYYSEFTINSDGKPDWGTYYGMTHSVKADNTRYLTAYVDRGAAITREPEYEGEEQKYWNGTRTFRVKDFDIVNDSDCWQLNQGNQPRTQIIYTDGLYKFRGIDKLESFPCKLATVRVGDFFYYFVNDDYVCTVTNKYFSDKDTVPGYFQQSGIKTDISNIVWLTGDAAKAKFDSLTDNGSKLMSEFAPSDWWKTENEASEHISSSDAAALGANYTFDTDTLTSENKGIVTPYIFFDGNFTFEWEYTFAADTFASASDWNRYMGLEVRHARDDYDSWSSNYGNNPAFLFGASRVDNVNGQLCAMAKCFSVNKPNSWDWEHPDNIVNGGEWYKFDGEMKLKYSVSRICTVDVNNKPLAKYTFKISRPDGTQLNVWTYDDHGALNWKSPCEPVILIWKNCGVKGTYSNIKWSVPEQSLSIVNKTELTARWAAGDSARMVDVSVFGLDDATVSSSDPTVISVSGKTLTPLKAGTATITAKSGNFTDSVTITVIPALSAVSVTNKEALTAAWKDDSTDTRTITVSLDPAEYYTLENTTVTVTSSDMTVISVDGFTLSVAGVGRATITVSALGKTDTVEIIITSNKPVITIADNVTDIYGPIGDEITLPAFTAVSSDGDDITTQVVVACDSQTATLNSDKTAITATAIGEYIVTYTIGDVTKDVTVHAHKKVFGSISGDGAHELSYTAGANYDNGQNPTAYISGDGIAFAQLDVTAGKVYYAEVTFTADSQGGTDMIYGVTHSAKGDNVKKYLAAFADRGECGAAGNIKIDRALKVKYFDMDADGWTTLDHTTSATPIYYALNDPKLRTSDWGNAFPLTISVMRNEKFFYVFVNDEYVMGYTNKELADIDTVPGIFQNSSVKTGILTSYLTGAEAIKKLNELTTDGMNFINAYRPFQENNNWSYGTSIDDNRFAVTCDETNGIACNVNANGMGDNDAWFSPYMIFDGDFTFEFEFAFASDTSSAGSNWSGNNKIHLAIQDYAYRDVKTFSVMRIDNNGNGTFINKSLDGATIDGTLNNEWFGATEKIKYTVTRSGGNYTISATSLENGSKAIRFTFTGSTDAVILSLKNVNINGAYTNIKWSASAAQAETV